MTLAVPTSSPAHCTLTFTFPTMHGQPHTAPGLFLTCPAALAQMWGRADMQSVFAGLPGLQDCHIRFHTHRSDGRAQLLLGPGHISDPSGTASRP